MATLRRYVVGTTIYANKDKAIEAALNRVLDKTIAFYDPNGGFRPTKHTTLDELKRRCSHVATYKNINKTRTFTATYRHRAYKMRVLVY